MTSPGQHILQLMKEKNLDINGLTKQIPCSPILMMAILYGEHEVTEMMAKKLEKVFGLPAVSWMEEEKIFRKHLEAKERMLWSRIDELG